jgi:filamentous hemagglutinin
MRSQGLISGDGPLLRGNPNGLMPTADALSWWNTTGRFFGPKAPEVRQFMLNPDNYVLQPSSINRSLGAQLGDSYVPPAAPNFAEPNP